MFPGSQGVLLCIMYGFLLLLQICKAMSWNMKWLFLQNSGRKKVGLELCIYNIIYITSLSVFYTNVFRRRIFLSSISKTITRWFKTGKTSTANTRIPFCVCAVGGVFTMIFKLKQLKFHHEALYRNSIILFHSNDPEFSAKNWARVIRKWSVECNSQLCIDLFAKIVMGWRKPLM